MCEREEKLKIYKQKKRAKGNFMSIFECVYTVRDIHDSLQFRINCDFFSSETFNFQKKREKNAERKIDDEHFHSNMKAILSIKSDSCSRFFFLT